MCKYQGIRQLPQDDAPPGTWVILADFPFLIGAAVILSIGDLPSNWIASGRGSAQNAREELTAVPEIYAA